MSVELLVPQEIHAEYITMKEIWEIPKCSATDRRIPNAVQTCPLYCLKTEITTEFSDRKNEVQKYIYVLMQ
jgi:hypothetical protein